MAQQNSRNSPHLSSPHLQNPSASSSPSMSNTADQSGNQRQQQQQQQQQQAQPVGFPSPTSYPSPSLSNVQYNYPPPGQPSQQEAYRASPTGSNGSLNLPSMRSLDPMQQQQPQGHHQMASNLPPVAQMQGGPYYHNPGQSLPHPSYPNVTSDPAGQNMRYALPHTDNGRVMSGGRHKKEIKRRTKTGCLTCRKRRIKCDEQHPACRNCQKSKRECLGYDPIFKQTPGPAAIQPAPQNMPPPNPYGQQPQMVYNNGGQVGVYDPALSADGSPASQNYDFTSAIDPALEAAAPSTANAASIAGATYTTPAKRTVTDLLAVGGLALPTSPISNSTVIDEIAQVYQTMYASALQEFLESRWFALKGWHKLKSDGSLLEAFSALLHQFTKQASSSAPEEGKIAFAAEGRTVWALASMTRGAVAELNGHITHRTVPPNDDPVEAANRLNVFETLLTGRVATGNSLTAPVPLSTDHHRLRELEFWHTLGNFATLNYEDSGPAATKAVDDNLSALRNLLDGRENRDVLYSIAVVRGLGQRVSEYTESDQPLHLDESDNKSKLLVAKKFISDEASGNGTTNVIRRFCELAARSWGVPAGAPSPAAK